MNGHPTRRAFLAALPFSFAALAAGRRPLGAGLVMLLEHPDPRPGIDGSGVLSARAVEAFGSDVVEIYDMVREIPEIADGIACYCGCAAMPNYRSLLTCYHQGGMAMGCRICQGEAQLAYRRAQEGQTLDQIRRAIDARFAR